MKWRTFVRGASLRPHCRGSPSLSPANTRVLKLVPKANLTVLDPIITTAAVTINHGWMVFDTLFGVDARLKPTPQMAEGYTVLDDGRTYLIRLRNSDKAAQRAGIP